MRYYYEDLYGYVRNPKSRNADYHHKDQLQFYGIGESDEEFRIRYQFHKDTVRVLCETLGKRVLPQVWG